MGRFNWACWGGCVGKTTRLWSVVEWSFLSVWRISHGGQLWRTDGGRGGVLIEADGRVEKERVAVEEKRRGNLC